MALAIAMFVEAVNCFLALPAVERPSTPMIGQLKVAMSMYKSCLLDQTSLPNLPMLGRNHPDGTQERFGGHHCHLHHGAMLFEPLTRSRKNGQS